MGRSWPEMADAFYRKKVARVVLQLREMADRIEQEGLDFRPSGSGLRYGNAASRVVHALTWGIANADVDGLVRAASDADQAHAEGAEASDG